MDDHQHRHRLAHALANWLRRLRLIAPTSQYTTPTHWNIIRANTRATLSHLGKNPLNCDCNLRWLVDYFEANPTVETSEARCEQPTRSQGRKLSQLNKNELRCQGKFNNNQGCASGCERANEVG